jgi:NAD(P)-dependent dehydrogenase (short-subunit alcohol dehydrogenase family)
MSKVVLITGASTGFGRAAAEILARRGFTVFATMRDIAGRNASHRDALQALARQERRALHVVELDVTSDASVELAVQQALAQAGRIDVAINNAGIAPLGITEAFTIAEFQQLLEVNLYGAARVNRAVLPSMRRQRSGLLIHVSSAAGRLVFPTSGIYCASKFALEALADAYRFELSPFGIDSVIVEPGIHRTPIHEKRFGPADQSRAADYGPTAERLERIKTAFDATLTVPDTPGPAPVAEAFLRLIETPAGERPFRTVPTAAIQPLLDPYNAQAAQLRQTVAQMFNLTDLTVLERTPAAAEA